MARTARKKRKISKISAEKLEYSRQRARAGWEFEDRVAAILEKLVTEGEVTFDTHFRVRVLEWQRSRHYDEDDRRGRDFSVVADVAINASDNPERVVVPFGVTLSIKRKMRSDTYYPKSENVNLLFKDTDPDERIRWRILERIVEVALQLF